MLNLSFQELFLRGIPEGFLIMFAMNIFSNTSIKVKKYIISSLLYAIIVYYIRQLPIQVGVHTILNIFIIIFISSYINRVDMIPAIRSSIMIIILELICETANVFVIKYIFKLDINYIFNNPNTKIFYGIPSLLLFWCFVTIVYLRKNRKSKLKDKKNGKTFG
ncbi:MAG: hypothetical protein AB6733_11365 [Clostridiaceae bacterium]